MSFELRFQLPGQLPRSVPIDQSRMMIGTLLSNHVMIRAPGVDPIHGLIEEVDGSWIITDVGSDTGIKVNNVTIDVETKLKPGDIIKIGSVEIEFGEAKPIVVPAIPTVGTSTSIPNIVPPVAGLNAQTNQQSIPKPIDNVEPARQTTQGGNSSGTSSRASSSALSEAQKEKERRNQKNILFSPREARPAGDILEVVAYWDDTVLDVDLFHPAMKNFDEVTIGVTPKAHFVAGGNDPIERHRLARFTSNGGFKLRLLKGMETRMRRGGKVEKIDGEGSVSLDRRDIAHIKYGPVRYFMLYVRPPEVEMRKQSRDPLPLWLSLFALVFYFGAATTMFLTPPAKDQKEDAEIFQYVEAPQEIKKPEPEKKPEPQKKPEVIVEKKPEPPQTPKPPPPPKPQPVKPVKPVEVEKVVQPKPVEKAAEKPVVAQQTPTPPSPKPPTPQAANPTPPSPKPDLSKLNPGIAGTAGTPSTGAKKPDFKFAGAPNNKPLGPAGGPKGSGNNQIGGARKGNKSHSVQGVEGVDNDKPSGPNLGKLGLGVGLVLNKAGPGAIQTNFQSSAGGAGGGAGSGSKTFGMGGIGNGKSLGLAGAGGAANNFGSGSGGEGGGQGGTGGFGGKGGGPGFGSGGAGKGRGGGGRADVVLAPGEMGVTGGLTAQEIQQVIRTHLNEIRHCYEQLLQRSPSAAGKIGVEFVVAVSGRVSSVKVAEATLNDSGMRSCVTGRIQRWDFPKPRGGQPVTVTYPFVFNPLN